MQLGSSCVCLHCAAAESSFTKLQKYHSDAGQLGKEQRMASQATLRSCTRSSAPIHDACFLHCAASPRKVSIRHVGEAIHFNQSRPWDTTGAAAAVKACSLCMHSSAAVCYIFLAVHSWYLLPELSLQSAHCAFHDHPDKWWRCCAPQVMSQHVTQGGGSCTVLHAAITSMTMTLTTRCWCDMHRLIL